MQMQMTRIIREADAWYEGKMNEITNETVYVKGSCQ